MSLNKPCPLATGSLQTCNIPSLDLPSKDCILALDFNLNAYDKSRFKNHGIILGPTFVKGKKGYALRFVSLTDRVQVEYALSVPLTVFMRFNPTKTDTYPFGEAREPSGDGFYCGFDISQIIKVTWVNTLGSYQSVSSSNTVSLNASSWMAVSLDDADGIWNLMVNGILTTKAYTGTPRTLKPFLVLGEYIGLKPYEGMIDQFYVYKKLLSASQMKLLGKGFEI